MDPAALVDCNVLANLCGSVMDGETSDASRYPQIKKKGCLFQDALATVCVSKKGQKTAIAVQVNDSAKKIRLVVAQNEYVSNATLRHLQKVWKKLSELSYFFEFARPKIRHSNFVGQSANAPARGTFPYIDAAVQDLGIMVYSFSGRSFHATIQKWWIKRGMKKFAERCKRQPSENLPGDQQTLWWNILALFSQIELVYGKLVNTRHGMIMRMLEDYDWKEVMEDMALIRRMAFEIKKSPGLCDKLLGSVAGPKPMFELHNALKNMTRLDILVNELIGYANSPRFRRGFLMELTVSKIRTTCPKAPPPAWPKSRAEWETLIAEVWKNRHTTIPPAYIREDAKKMRKYLGRVRYLKTHCECALAAYLDNTRYSDDDEWSDMPALRVIGVSKSSCMLCAMWLQSFRTSGKRDFRLRHSGEFERTWYMPVLEDGEKAEKVRAHFVGQLVYFWAWFQERRG
ncbi:hypothetical protein K440DRAFT_645588 [Wilcoxina mikolae CBS 423.85]|nr:hypothetical protein K440DRAFT_645588 [Wilcoxina mikolae CBS 423.85]